MCCSGKRVFHMFKQSTYVQNVRPVPGEGINDYCGRPRGRPRAAAATGGAGSATGGPAAAAVGGGTSAGAAGGGAAARAAGPGAAGARCALATSSFSVGDILAGVPRMASSSCSWLLASEARRRTPRTIIAPDLVATAWESLLFVRPSQVP